jgi:hypothetical protein
VTTSDPPVAKPAYKRKRYILSAIAVVLGIVVLIVTPIVLQRIVVNALIDKGQHDATIGNIDFNPFTGRVLLETLEADSDPEGTLNVGRIELELEWFPLLRQRAVVQRVTIEDVDLHVGLHEDGQIYVGQMTFGGRKAKTPSDPLGWGFGADELVLRNATIDIGLPDINNLLHIREAHFDTLRSWDKDNPVPFRIDATANDATIQLEGSAQPFTRMITVDSRVRLGQYSLGRIAPLLEAAKVYAFDGKIDVDLNVEATIDLTDKTLKHRAEGEFGFTDFTIATHIVEMSLGTFAWNGSLDGEGPFSALALNADGSFTATQAMVRRIDGPAFVPDTFDWNGNLALALGTDPVLTATGAAHVQQARLMYLGEDIAQGLSETAAANLDGLSVTFAKGGSRTLAGNASIDLNGLTLEGTEARPNAVQMAKLAITAQQFHTVIEAGRAYATGDFKVDSTASDIRIADSPLTIRHNTLGAQARGTWTLEEGMTADIQGAVQAGNLSLHNHVLDQGLAAVDALTVASVSLASDDAVAADGISFGGVRVFEQPESNPDAGESQYAINLGQVTISGLRQSEARAEVDTVEVDALQMNITRYEDGTMGFAKLVEPDGATEDASAPESSSRGEDDATDPTYRVGQLTLTGDSRIAFTDQSVTPHASLEASPVTLSLTKIDTATPDRPGAIQLEASLSEYSNLTISGTLAPLAERTTADVRATLAAIDLPPFTGYPERNIGYRVQTGVLSADADIKINAGKLDTESTLTINNLQLERLSSDELDELAEQIGMPLDAAVGLLKDGDGIIELSIPVTGDLADPDINITDGIRQAIAGAVKKGVLTVFAPVRIVGAVGKEIVGGGDGLDLKVVAFEPKRAKLSNEAEDYLNEVATVLTKHTALQLNVCGFATRADVSEAFDDPDDDSELPPEEAAETSGNEAVLPERKQEQLRELATERAERVKAHLVEKGGIDPQRLSVCAPNIDVEDDDGADPRVELSL